jgi:Leucine-rich repeat (LRR) protein
LVIVEYFDDLAAKVNSKSAKSGDQLTNSIRAEFLNEIELVRSKCLADFKTNSSQIRDIKNERDLKTRLFTKFCFIVAKNNQRNLQDTILFITDRYMDDYQIWLFSKTRFISNGLYLNLDNPFCELDEKDFFSLSPRIDIKWKEHIDSATQTCKLSGKDLFEIEELTIENCRLKSIRDEARFLFGNIKKLTLIYEEMDTINSEVDLKEIIEQFEIIFTSSRPIENISLVLKYDNFETCDFLALKSFKIRSLHLEANSTENKFDINDLKCLEHLEQVHLLLDENIDLVNFSNLKYLQLLDLSCNRINLLNSDFITTNLEKLDLFNNEISKIELDPKRSVKLKSLNLNLNKLESVSGTDFSCLVDLNELFLSENRILVISPFAFSNMNCLLRLDLSGNCLKTIEKAMFDKLVLLEDLDLSDNEIEIPVGSSPFGSLNRLKKLNLRGNYLNQIDKSLLEGLESVEDLNFSRNMISVVNFDSLSNMKCLKRLNLSLNRIENFDKTSLEKLNLNFEI